MIDNYMCTGLALDGIIYYIRRIQRFVVEDGKMLKLRL